MTTPFQATQSFVPTQIPGCQLWFDAADTTTFSYSSGTTISEWRDKSSNRYSVIQPTSGRQPSLTFGAQNSLPGIQFASNYYLYQASTSMPNFTTGGSTSVMMVARNAANNDSWNIINTIWFDSAGGSGTLRYHFSFNQNTTDGTTLYTNGSLVGIMTSNVVAPSANAILGFTASPTSQTIHTNGSTNSYAGATLPNATGSSAFTFNDARNNAASANTMIFEMVGYNTQISVAERQLLEAYLAWKWGLVVNLPADHPYKTTPILSLPPFPNAPRVATLINNPVFSPTQISGCYLWLDAADSGQIVLFPGTSNISRWLDKSSNAFHATAAGNPTYSGSRIQFNGTTSYLSNLSYSLNLSQRSIFIVMSENSRTNVAGVFSHIPNPRTGNDYSTTNGLSIETTNGLYFYGNNGGYASAIGNATLLALGIYNDTMSGTQGSSFFNGSNTSNRTANYTAGTCAGYVLGARWLGALGGPYLNGNINEIIVYNSPVSTSQRQQIEGYLAWKWQLTGSLINTQPYKAPLLAPFSYGVRRATQNSWIPLNITNSVLWLDAKSPSSIVPSSGGTMTSITDKSAEGKSITITNTVIYTANTAIVFTDINGRLNLAGMPAAPYDYIFVGTANSSSATWRSMLRTESGTGTLPFLLQSGTNNAGMWNGAAFYQFGSLTQSPNEKAMFYGSMAANRTITASKNGTLALTSATPAGDGSILTTVGNNSSASQPYGQLHELIIYSITLSFFQRQQVEGYLAWKWGLQGNLPSNHPYKLFPPSP